MNDRIRGREVRLIDADGEQVGVVSREEALRRAEELDLDLVLMSPGDPPVCRLMDYAKHRYLEQRRVKEARHKQAATRQHTKNVQFRPKIAEHDYDFKRNNVRKFLTNGDRVQVQVFFRGREAAHPEIGTKILERLLNEIKDIGHAVSEQLPRLEGRAMTMMLEPGAKKSKRVEAPAAVAATPESTVEPVVESVVESVVDTAALPAVETPPAAPAA